MKSETKEKISKTTSAIGTVTKTGLRIGGKAGMTILVFLGGLTAYYIYLDMM